VLAALAPLGCIEGIGEIDVFEPNVTVLPAADIVTTDEAVLVAGVPRMDYGARPRGMFAQHAIEYSYGGPFEPLDGDLSDESFYVDVARRVVTGESPDTVRFRYLELGDVALQGTAATVLRIDSVRVFPDPPPVRVYANFILNRVLVYAVERKIGGGSVVFATAPYYQQLLAGGEVNLSATGSSEIEPLLAPVRFASSARVIGLWNGQELDFERSRPVLRTDRPLVIAVSRALDPDRAWIWLAWFPRPGSGADPDAVRRASAVFELHRPTDRIVIPASALADLASHLPGPEGGFVLRISEYLVDDDAFDIGYASDGTAETLSRLQANVVTVLVRIVR
jgi:hypothetical protein